MLAMAAAGCEAWSERPATPAYMPSWEEAARALESALTAWRDAPSPPPESFASPAIQFVDQQRRPGQRLLSFEVLGRVDVENARQFTVRLTLKDEDEPQLVRYNCFGRQPVWVFRLEDYERLAHWEHKMDEPSATPDQNRGEAQNGTRQPPG
jgi:hypothetical protein